jgi:hypothetical protein
LNPRKIAEFITIFKPCSTGQTLKILALESYKLMGTKHIDLVERRRIKGEKIPHDIFFFLYLNHTSNGLAKAKQG